MINLLFIWYYSEQLMIVIFKNHLYFNILMWSVDIANNTGFSGLFFTKNINILLFLFWRNPTLEIIEIINNLELPASYKMFAFYFFTDIFYARLFQRFIIVLKEWWMNLMFIIYEFSLINFYEIKYLWIWIPFLNFQQFNVPLFNL